MVRVLCEVYHGLRDVGNTDQEHRSGLSSERIRMFLASRKAVKPWHSALGVLGATATTSVP